MCVWLYNVEEIGFGLVGEGMVVVFFEYDVLCFVFICCNFGCVLFFFVYFINGEFRVLKVFSCC